MNTTGDITAARVAAAPGLAARLLRADDSPESLGAYIAADGYQDGPAGRAGADELLDAIERSGLRGRGGAAFPFAVKARAVHRMAQLGRTPVVVANGEEGEPASVKDRWLLRTRPHLVLDGLRLAAAVAGAGEAYVYVSDPRAARSVAGALHDAELTGRSALPVKIIVVEPGYVAGEETAAVRAINGGPAKPTDKPPRPFEAGVGDRPTLVSNVETLANLPFVRRHGPAAYRQAGTPGSPGTFLATVTGGGRPPALYELPHGLPFRELLALHQVPEDAVHGLLMGGYFAGLLGRQVLDMTLDHESARALGAGLGCGALSILEADDCPVAVAASVMAYFARENAGQCGSCFNGTAAMSAVLDALRDGAAGDDDLARLGRWSRVLRGRGACGTLDGAVNLAASLLAQFPGTVTRHLEGGCDRCGGSPFRASRPFEVEPAGLA
ncbi:MAG TPA: NADH-ubiquinone oxidoreductase-F iron-sulfur binding region domain-containing protein [Trebonia sp.]|jgi:NADH:ubiquinone oxidoreductase subunit F (NADH-binding)